MEGNHIKLSSVPNTVDMLSHQIKIIPLMVYKAL